MKATYYFAEVGNPNSYCQATKIEAENLTAAKKTMTMRDYSLVTSSLLATTPRATLYQLIGLI